MPRLVAVQLHQSTPRPDHRFASSISAGSGNSDERKRTFFPVLMRAAPDRLERRGRFSLYGYNVRVDSEYTR